MEKTVIIYTTPTCSYCAQAKEFMKEHNVPYVEHDVATDAEKRQEMIELTGQMGVPVIVVGDEAMVGYDQKKLAELTGVEV